MLHLEFPSHNHDHFSKYGLSKEKEYLLEQQKLDKENAWQQQYVDPNLLLDKNFQKQLQSFVAFYYQYYILNYKKSQKSKENEIQDVGFFLKDDKEIDSDRKLSDHDYFSENIQKNCQQIKKQKTITNDDLFELNSQIKNDEIDENLYYDDSKLSDFDLFLKEDIKSQKIEDEELNIFNLTPKKNSDDILIEYPTKKNSFEEYLDEQNSDENILKENYSLINQNTDLLSNYSEESTQSSKTFKAKGNKKYSKDERKKVKMLYDELLENFLKVESDKEEAKRLARLAISQNEEFKHISRQLLNHWLKRKSSDDQRKNNKGSKGLIYKTFNADLIQELPQRIFECREKSFFKTTIYNKIALDLYRENEKKYANDIQPVQVFPEKGKKRKVLTKCWFEGFAKKYDFNLKTLKKRKVGNRTEVLEFHFNGQTFKREDYV